MKLNKNTKICIFGLGYVGLPLAIAFEKYFSVIGYDINLNRINALKKNIDITKEVSKKALVKAKSIKFTSNKKDIGNIDIFIVTVPTPIYKTKKPDLRLLIKSCNTIGQLIKKITLSFLSSYCLSRSYRGNMC